MHFQEFCYKLIWFASRTKEQSVMVLSHSLQGNIYRKSSVMPPEDRLISVSYTHLTLPTNREV